MNDADAVSIVYFESLSVLDLNVYGCLWLYGLCLGFSFKRDIIELDGLDTFNCAGILLQSFQGFLIVLIITFGIFLEFLDYEFSIFGNLGFFTYCR